MGDSSEAVRFDELEEQLSEIADRLRAQHDEINSRVRETQLEVASRRSLEKVVVFLGYAAIAAGVLIGAIGYNEIADIDSTVGEIVSRKTNEIDNKIADAEQKIDSALTVLDLTIDKKISDYVGENEHNRAKLESGIEDAQNLIRLLGESQKYWIEIVKPKIDALAAVDTGEDIKSQYLLIDRDGDLKDPEFRAHVTQVLNRIIKHINRSKTDKTTASQFAPDDYFNIAQLARRISRADLELALIKSAYEATQTAATQALFLQSRAVYTTGDEQDQSLSELMRMVETLSIDNPQIVLAEAWNAVESLRRYNLLIVAVDSLIERHRADSTQFLPSYAYVTKGQAHQRRGLPGDIDQAISAYVQAIHRLKTEGMTTQWAGSTVSDLTQQIPDLVEAGIDIAPITEAAARSQILDLNLSLFAVAARLERKRGLLEEMRLLSPSSSTF